jgi:hypothetical protein
MFLAIEGYFNLLRYREGGVASREAAKNVQGFSDASKKRCLSDDASLKRR